MKVISVINQKGGVGKSTTALALGAGIIKAGYKVLYIDLDPQGNLSYALDADTSTYSVLNLLQQPTIARKAIQTTRQGDTIASTPSLAGADTVINETGKEYKLKEGLEALKGDYDYCIIDTPPALGILTVNALTASDYAIVPAQADAFSLQGIGQLYATVDAVRKYTNPRLNILGVLMTRYNNRTIITKDMTEIIENTAKHLDTKVFKTKIREATAIKEAQALKQDIFSYAPKSNASNDYQAFVTEVLEGVGINE